MEHIPVLVSESIDGLRVRADGVYIDGTLGRGGHSYEIARRLTCGRLIAVDRDMTAIEEAGKKLSEFRDRITFVHGNFEDIGTILDNLGILAVDGMLFDFGVSSPQLDDRGRGFSYHGGAEPLDMRMDLTQSLTAYTVVNEWSEGELCRIFFEYGEERYSRLIARALVRRRKESAVCTTDELNEIILGAIPSKARREKQHPCMRVYQAIRIAVNDELGAIERMLEAAPRRLVCGGRICVISFHSLEDRLVKRTFMGYEKGCRCPVGFPVCVCGFSPLLRVITRRPAVPDLVETERNPRARSAKLRIAERV